MAKPTFDHSVLEGIGSILEQAEMAGRKVDQNEELLMSGALDSLKIVKLVAHIEQRFGCTIDAAEVLPENFESALAIAVFVASKTEA